VESKHQAWQGQEQSQKLWLKAKDKTTALTYIKA